MAGQREMADFTWDTADFEAALSQAFADMRITSARQLAIKAITVANRAKAFCAVDTGRLRSTIGTSDVGEDIEGLFVDVGVTAADLLADGALTNYAPFVEFGTSKMRPEPFMRPALAEVTGLE